MLRVGSSLPKFEAKTTEGQIVSDVSLRGSPCVLFFFPRAFTTGCIREAKAFRDVYPRLRALGAELVGISTDPLARQCKFAEWAGAAYPMVGDAEHSLARAFGVLWPIVPIAKRVTFVADAQGIIQNVLHFEVAIDRHVMHAESALRVLVKSP